MKKNDSQDMSVTISNKVIIKCSLKTDKVFTFVLEQNSDGTFYSVLFLVPNTRSLMFLCCLEYNLESTKQIVKCTEI